MHLKKIIMTGTAMAFFMGSLLNVSAAELSASNYVKSLRETEKESLIINVAAYKAAYPDLAEAFGDNENAYIEHYLTTGIFEGRTKGILFDPLTYAEAYGDVKAAFGDNIYAIINHYVTFGAAENRTMGTANGYEDLAAAEKDGHLKVTIPRNINGVNSYNANAAVNGYETNAVSNDNMVVTGNSNITVTGSSNNGGNVPAAANSTMAAGSSSTGPEVSSSSASPAVSNSTASPTVNAASNNSTASANSSTNTAVNTGSSNNSAPAANTGSSNAPAPAVNTGSSNAPAPAASTDNVPASTAPGNDSASASSTDNSPSYNHTTSIYDESGLLRVEYYDDNNKLFEYSDVTNYDKDTNSYTENVYQFDEEKNEETLVRTDTYENGQLTSSKKH